MIKILLDFRYLVRELKIKRGVQDNKKWIERTKKRMSGILFFVHIKKKKKSGIS